MQYWYSNCNKASTQIRFQKDEWEKDRMRKGKREKMVNIKMNSKQNNHYNPET